MISIRSLRRGVATVALAWIGAPVVGVWLAPAPAFAAGRIVDVRVGRHDEFTRIVFELDGATAHRVEQPPGGQELIVRLGAGSPPREILTNSDVVQAVRLEPKGGETIAHLVLRSSRVRVSELTLESPPRLVIDVRPGEPAAPPAVALTLAPKPLPAPPPAPPPIAKPAPSLPPIVNSASSPPAVVEDETEATPGVDEIELLVQADTDAAADDAADAAAADTAAAARLAASAAPSKAAAPAPSPSLAPAAPAPPRPAPAFGLPPVTPHPSADGIGAYLPEGIDPRLLGGAVALLAGFLLWGLLGRRDRTAREVEAHGEDGANVFSDREAGWPEAMVPASAMPAIEVPHETERRDDDGLPSHLPLFSARNEEPVAIEAADDDDMPAPVDLGATARRLSVVPVEPPAAPEPAGPAFGTTAMAASPGASFDAGSRLADLERRIALLERKLEDAADVRERLERQVVAQTEELRVQRAAIARTQRVLRTLARPDDLPIEPAPRGSGPVGGG